MYPSHTNTRMGKGEKREGEGGAYEEILRRERRRALEEGSHGGNDGDPAATDTSGPLQYGSLTYLQFTSDYYALYTYAAFLFLPVPPSPPFLSSGP